MIIVRRGALALAAVAAGIGACAGAQQVLAGCVRGMEGDMRELAVTPSRALAPDEAFALVVEAGDLAEGDILTVFGPKGEIVGSVVGSPLSPGPQEYTVGLIDSIEGETLSLRVRVQPEGDAALRPPSRSELLSLKLVPIEVTR